MPTLTQPPLPEDVAAAIDALGNSARAYLLHILSSRGEQTAAELAEAISSDRRSALRHVLTLENVGAVRGDVPTEQRHGRTVRWSINDARVAELTALVDRYLRGRSR